MAPDPVFDCAWPISTSRRNCRSMEFWESLRRSQPPATRMSTMTTPTASLPVLRESPGPRCQKRRMAASDEMPAASRLDRDPVRTKA